MSSRIDSSVPFTCIILRTYFHTNILYCDFQVLVPKLKENDPNPGVTIAVLTAIGDLAQVSETEMRLWSPELLPILLEMLADASMPAKREVALWTLAQLIESTGYD